MLLRSPRIPLLAALATFVGLGLTGLLAYLSPIAQARDGLTLHAFLAINRPRLTPLIDHVAHLADPGPYALIGFSLAAVAFARRRRRVAAAIVFLLFATGMTTELLKQLLAHPRYSEWLGDGQIAAASWPSGHATAAMTLTLCAILAVPARMRPTAGAIGAVFSVAVSYAILALGWHFPSDVFGGFLVSATWTLLAVAVLVKAEEVRPALVRREPVVEQPDPLGPIIVGAGAAAGVVAIALSRPDSAASFAQGHTTFVIAAAAIAALATMLSAGLVRAIRA